MPSPKTNFLNDICQEAIYDKYILKFVSYILICTKYHISTPKYQEKYSLGDVYVLPHLIQTHYISVLACNDDYDNNQPWYHWHKAPHALALSPSEFYSELVK